MMLNFKVTMVADALAAHTDAEHNASLATFYSVFGDVQTVDEAIAALDRGAGLAAEPEAAIAAGSCMSEERKAG
jgi:ureidoacrylate peracid hydrolase